jgi:membrane-associated phospholipid phosphatase
MDALIAQTSINIWFQGMGISILPVFQFFSSLGTEQFFLLVIPLIYWTIDSKIGLKLALMLLISGGINSILKFSFHAPRPNWINPNVKTLAGESSFGFPSGHSQNSLSVFGLYALSTRSRILKIIIAIVIAFIGLSRIYLGVHFLTDVLGGWLIGYVILGLFMRLGAAISDWFHNKSLPWQILASLVTSLLIVAVTLTVQYLNHEWQFPQDWMTNIQQGNYPQLFNPFEGSEMITVAGMWFGVMAGYSWIQNIYPGNKIISTPNRRFFMYIIGMIGLLAIWYGLGLAFPRTTDLTGISLRYFRYFLVGIWITGAAPILFYKTNLRSIS